MVVQLFVCLLWGTSVQSLASVNIGDDFNIVFTEEVRVKLISHDKTIALHDVRLAEFDLRLQCTETTNYDGILIWKVTEYRRRKRDAVNGKRTRTQFIVDIVFI